MVAVVTAGPPKRFLLRVLLLSPAVITTRPHSALQLRSRIRIIVASPDERSHGIISCVLLKGHIRWRERIRRRSAVTQRAALAPILFAPRRQPDTAATCHRSRTRVPRHTRQHRGVLHPVDRSGTILPVTGQQHHAVVRQAVSSHAAGPAFVPFHPPRVLALHLPSIPSLDAIVLLPIVAVDGGQPGTMRARDGGGAGTGEQRMVGTGGGCAADARAADHDGLVRRFHFRSCIDVRAQVRTG
mmetsp:Transcript_42442/g.89119  ORF Transcript_42442/g.89119 Transcript_42442/m.89119 type:complete len:242 (+) Transcript_42442:142-867(+)